MIIYTYVKIITKFTITIGQEQIIIIYKKFYFMNKEIIYVIYKCFLLKRNITNNLYMHS